MSSARIPQFINHRESHIIKRRTTVERTLLTSGCVSRCCPFKKYYFFAPQLQYLRKVINSPPYIPCVLVGKLRLWQQQKQGQLSGQFPARWTSAALVVPKEGKKKLSFCLGFFYERQRCIQKSTRLRTLCPELFQAPSATCDLKHFIIQQKWRERQKLLCETAGLLRGSAKHCFLLQKVSISHLEICHSFRLIHSLFLFIFKRQQ